MLRSPKKPVLIQAQPTHVDLFVEYYDLLRRWALQFTEHNQDLAEDLLHDTFIHFTLSKPDLALIQNLDGFLFVMMRNLHLSQLRRATRSPIRSFAVIEYDTADMSFWASDPRDHLRMRDELNAVCQFACIRKEGSKAGSILILRFFHGYYPDEIALVMHTTRGAVNAGLKQARAEARLYLKEPERLGFVGEKTLPTSKITLNSMGGDLRLALRSQIFDSRQGECLKAETLGDFYKPEKVDGTDRKVLAHIVSCQTCIENVNSLLGLPPLASRYPLDTIGKDPGKKGGSGGGAGGTGGGPNMLDSYISRRDAHYHHEPKELCISVNGQLQGLQKIVSGKGELMLILDTNENLGFVEVFSELGLRLLMLNVEPPPSGDGKQSTRIELSGGRSIDASLNFSGAHPALQVTYYDPELSFEFANEAVEAPGAADDQLVPPLLTGTASVDAKQFEFNSFLGGLKFWLQPERLTAVFAVLIAAIAGVLYLIRPVEKAQTASDVLANAAQNEIDIAARPDVAIRSTFRIEEYSNGSLVSQRRVDAWQKSDGSARRIFDDKGKMIAGQWHKDGKSQVFRAGEKLRSATADEGSTDEISNISPSAKQFASLMEKTGLSSQLKLEVSANAYNLTYKKEPGAERQAKTNFPGELLLASLVLDRTSLDPRSEVLVLQIGDETKEYRFTDIRVDQKPLDAVSPLIFLPEKELLHGATKVSKPIEIEPLAQTEESVTAAAPPNMPKATSAEEVEVLDLLNRAGADITEQMNVTRTADGRLLVEGLVETNQRKKEILNALAPVRNNPAIRIKVQTLEEATKALQKAKQQSAPGAVEQLQAQKDAAIDPQLREYFERQGVDPAEAVGRFAERAIGRSQAAVFQASALNRMANRFNAEQLKELDAGSRAKWLSILKRYASAVRRETAVLRNELDPVFGGFGDGGGETVTSDADLIASARRLYELAAANDRVVRSAFTFSSGGASVQGLKTAQFRRSVAQAVALAAAIEKVH